MGTLDEDPYKFMIVSRSVFLSVKILSDKSCGKNQNKSFIFNCFKVHFDLLNLIYTN